MDKKNLAKATLLAMALTAGAVSADAATTVNSFETSTLLAVAGCPAPSPQRQGGGYYGNGNQGGYSNQGGYGYSNGNQVYSDYDHYTADDAGNPYATPSSRGSMSSSPYGSSPNAAGRQGGGYGTNSGWHNNSAMSGGGSQANPYGSDQRYQSSGSYNSSPTRSAPQAMGGGSYGSQRSSSYLSTDDDDDSYGGNTSH